MTVSCFLLDVKCALGAYWEMLARNDAYKPPEPWPHGWMLLGLVIGLGFCAAAWVAVIELVISV
ncbi:hypothetical protein MESS2_530001 [Mesorhizobium metallidurans STM 2683]|uniref:Uncharacterized protein n=1 Tax=Mesorhizobium metallidurans STM 2683 TaxID=1297569 RepID=M5ESV1_9HYPH|nr:hypothetical protein MESS2_530001 [Mesorhizobium metallidurans STM 2683]